MAEPKCPVHDAARESRARQSVEALLTKVGLRQATVECRECKFCQAALECIRIQNSPSGKPDQAWMHLWHDPFAEI